jgi:hypothetical protein
MDEMMKKEGEHMCGGCGSGCKCPHHMMPALLVILFGLLFLLKDLGMIGASTVNFLWPILVIALGAMKLTGKKCKCGCGC